MEDTVDDLNDWSHLFSGHSNPYYGYCENAEQVEELIQLFSYVTSTSYIYTRAPKAFGRVRHGLFSIYL